MGCSFKYYIPPYVTRGTFSKSSPSLLAKNLGSLHQSIVEFKFSPTISTHTFIENILIYITQLQNTLLCGLFYNIQHSAFKTRLILNFIRKCFLKTTYCSFSNIGSFVLITESSFNR
jgi:hypothetical protein